jgi:hypothetical protein
MRPGEVKGNVVLETTKEIEESKRAIKVLSIGEHGDDQLDVLDAEPPVEIDTIDVRLIMRGLRSMSLLSNAGNPMKAKTDRLLADFEANINPKSSA